MSDVRSKSVTIANAATTSGAIQLDERVVCGIEFPAAFTGATVGFEVSADGTNYFDLYDDAGSAISVTATVSTVSRLIPADFAMAKYLKVKSASSEGAERTVKIWVRTET